MSDIASSTRNFNDYQLIMSILWKRLNDTGKDWRHVYKSLTVLEFLVAQGAERVIDELREHQYQVQVGVSCLSVAVNVEVDAACAFMHVVKALLECSLLFADCLSIL